MSTRNVQYKIIGGFKNGCVKARCTCCRLSGSKTIVNTHDSIYIKHMCLFILLLLLHSVTLTVLFTTSMFIQYRYDENFSMISQELF